MRTTINRRRWRSLLINPSAQLRLATGHLCFLIVVFLALLFILLSPLNVDLPGADPTWHGYVAAYLRLAQLERAGWVLAAAAVIFIVYFVVVSHRFCGPLVNMTHTFNALAEGDTTRCVYLRRKDFFKTEANTINTMLQAVSQRIVALRESQQEMDNLSLRLPPEPASEQLRKCLRDHRNLLDQWVVMSAPPIKDHQPVTAPIARDRLAEPAGHSRQLPSSPQRHTADPK